MKKSEKCENGDGGDDENGGSNGKKEPAPARPERLKMRLSNRLSENGTKEETTVIRQPKGPEAVGVKGFGRAMSRPAGADGAGESSDTDPDQPVNGDDHDQEPQVEDNDQDQDDQVDIENDFEPAEE